MNDFIRWQKLYHKQHLYQFPDLNCRNFLLVYITF